MALTKNQIHALKVRISKCFFAISVLFLFKSAAEGCSPLEAKEREGGGGGGQALQNDIAK